MKCLVENRFHRESLTSSLSSDGSANDSFDSIGHEKEMISEHESSKGNGFCWTQLLFFGPLILFLLLFIGSIAVFFLIQRTEQIKTDDGLKFDEQFSDDPLICAISKSESVIPFVNDQLNCGLNRSSIIRIYYSNRQTWIKPGDNLTRFDVRNPPRISFNWKFLSKFYTKSFVLILIDPTLLKFQFTAQFIILNWIRYYSSSLEDKEDICSYRYMNEPPDPNSQRIVLLYATNSSRMMLRAKTICNTRSHFFVLDQYVNFARLQLVASTYFLMIYTDESDE